MVTGASMMATVLPTVVGAAVITRVVEVTLARDRKGKLMGTTHYHYKGKTGKVIRHKHPGGHVSHMHKGLPGYGRTRKSLRR